VGAALLLASAAGGLGCRANAGARSNAELAALGRRCAPPVSAPDPLVIEGTLLDFSAGEQPVAGGLVEARTPDGRAVTRTVSDGLGQFALEIPTGGRPFLGRLRASREGLLPSNFEVVGGFGHSMSGWRQELVDDQAFAESAADQGMARSAADVYTADEDGHPDATVDGYGLAWSFKVAPGTVHIVTTKDGATTSYATRVDAGEELFVFDYL
jgi:hypothetical protein